MRLRVWFALGLFLALAAGIAPGEAGASYGELPTGVEPRVPVVEDPGQAGGNVYYQECLRRRSAGDMACGEICYWRECVQCQNLCACNPCDDCPDDDAVEGRRFVDPGRALASASGGGISLERLLELEGRPGFSRVTSRSPDVWEYGSGKLPPEQGGGVDYGFPYIWLGCPDDSKCPDLSCECGGGECWAYCGACIWWEWRFLGPAGSGRYPGTSGAGFNVYPVDPADAALLDFNSTPQDESYWRRDNASFFDMAQETHIMADYYLRISSRCADLHGVRDDQYFQDAGFNDFENPADYSWLHNLPQRSSIKGRTDAVLAPGTMNAAEVTPEPFAERARICEQQLRTQLEALAGGNSNVLAALVQQAVSQAVSSCGQGVWAPAMSVGISTAPNEINHCPAVYSGYYANAVAGMKAGTLVVHWRANEPSPGDTHVEYSASIVSSNTGGSPGSFTHVRGQTPTPMPTPTPLPPPGHVLDHGSCWLYHADDGWRSVAAERSFNPSHSAYTNTDTDEVFNAHFLGFVNSRPAPYQVITRPTGVIVSHTYGSVAPPPWLQVMVNTAARRGQRHFVSEGCQAAPNVTVVVDEGTSDQQTVVLGMQACWVYYKGAVRLDRNWQYLNLEVYENVTSAYGTRRVPLRRFMDPVTGSGVSALYGERDCEAPGSCLEPWTCPYYNDRGMLKSSFLLQAYPAEAGETVGNTRTTGLELCEAGNRNCEAFSALVAFPSPRQADGSDVDNYELIKAGDWSIPDGHTLHYNIVQRDKNGKPVLDGGGNARKIAVSRPWVGYRPVQSGGYTVLEYTDTLGFTSEHNPGLEGRCRPVCPYLEPGPAGETRNSLRWEYEEAGKPWVKHTLTWPGGRELDMAKDCQYAGNGLVECGDFREISKSAAAPTAAELPHGRFRFSYDLPYPYCPTLLSSQRATMENYRMPDWNYGGPYLMQPRDYTP